MAERKITQEELESRELLIIRSRVIRNILDEKEVWGIPLDENSLSIIEPEDVLGIGNTFASTKDLQKMLYLLFKDLYKKLEEITLILTDHEARITALESKK